MRGPQGGGLGVGGEMLLDCLLVAALTAVGVCLCVGGGVAQR